MAELGVTAWCCEKCQERGFVTYDNDAGVQEVRYAIANDHREHDRVCAVEFGLTHIRVEVK